MSKHNNLAYDYDAYDEELDTERKIAHYTNPAKNKSISGVKSLMVAIAAMFLFGSMIYGRVELSRLYTEQASMQEELDQLTNENISLESELAQKTGLTKVEAYAEDELGLQKLDKSQIEYIEVERETVAEVVAQDDPNVFVKLKRWFNDALEYIGAK